MQTTVRALQEETARRARSPRRSAALLLDVAAGGPEPAADPLVGLLAEVRVAITRYVYGLRAEGAPAEKMLPRVKALVREAMAAEGWRDPEAAQALTAQVVGWSIAAYYDG